jgi:hypothetical protein
MKFPLAFLVMLSYSCTSTEKPPAVLKDNSSNSIPTSQLNNKDSVIWNIPELICMNLDDIENILGPKIGDTLGDDTNKNRLGQSIECSFEKGEHTLYVNYNQKNHKINYFLIDAIESKNISADGTTNDYSDLLKFCNIGGNSSTYKIVPVSSDKISNRYQAIKIVPNCK